MGLTLGLDTGRGDVLFGTTVSGRSPEFEGAESIIGMTLGAVPVRVEARAADSLIEVALRVQAAQTTVMDDHWVGLPAISVRWGSARCSTLCWCSRIIR